MSRHEKLRSINVVQMICDLLEQLAPDKPTGVNRNGKQTRIWSHTCSMGS